MMERFLWVTALSLPLLFAIGGMLSRRAQIGVPSVAALPIIYGFLLVWMGFVHVKSAFTLFLLLGVAGTEYASVVFWLNKNKSFVELLWRTLAAIVVIGGATILAMYFVALAKEGF